MEDSKDLRVLVKQAQDGDPESFGEIYELLVDRIYRFIFFRTSKKEEAEDMTETVFLKAYEKLPSYQDRGLPFEAWLFQIARNLIIDYYRTRKAQIQLDEISETPAKDPPPEELAEHSLNQEMVFLGLRKLPPSYQEIIILKFVEDRGNEEISQFLKKPVDQVRVLQSRALKALRKAVDV